MIKYNFASDERSKNIEIAPKKLLPSFNLLLSVKKDSSCCSLKFSETFIEVKKIAPVAPVARENLLLKRNDNSSCSGELRKTFIKVKKDCSWIMFFMAGAKIALFTLKIISMLLCSYCFFLYIIVVYTIYKHNLYMTRGSYRARARGEHEERVIFGGVR